MEDLADTVKVELNPGSENGLEHEMDMEQSVGADDMIDIGEVKIETYIEKVVETAQCSATIPEYSKEKQSTDETYGTKTHLRQHIEVKNALPSVFKCQQCEVSFRFEIELRNHERSQQHLNKLKSHMKCHAAKTYACSFCEKLFINEKNLARHVASHEGEREKHKAVPSFKCDICQKMFLYKWAMAWHKRKEHEPETHHCNVCGSRFSTSEYLGEHIKIHEESSRIKTNEKQQSLQEEVKVKIEPLEEATEPQPQREGEDEMMKNEQSLGIEDMIDIEDVKIESREDDYMELDTFTSNQVSQPINKSMNDFKQIESATDRADVNQKKNHAKDKHMPTSVGQAKTVTDNKETPTSLECKICHRTFKWNYRLRYHEKEAHGPKIYDCDICDASFHGSRNHLAQHLDKHKKEKEAGFCSLQAMQRDTAARLKEDTEMKVSELNSERTITTDQNMTTTSLQYAKCFKVWPNQNRLWRHYKTAHRLCETKNSKKKNLQCSLCSAMFHFQTQLNKHMNSLHKQEDGSFQPLKCVECNKQFETSKKYRRHMLNHAPKKYKCTNCSLSFRTTVLLELHQRVHKFDGIVNTTDVPVQCKTCGKILESSMKLWHHNRKVHRPKKIECPICGRPCFDSYVLKRHIQTHQPIHERKKPRSERANDNVEGSFRCDICDKSFARRYLLNQHNKKSHGPKIYCCDMCEGKFTSRSVLTRHLSTHKRDTALLEVKLAS